MTRTMTIAKVIVMMMTKSGAMVNELPIVPVVAIILSSDLSQKKRTATTMTMIIVQKNLVRNDIRDENN